MLIHQKKAHGQVSTLVRKHKPRGKGTVECDFCKKLFCDKSGVKKHLKTCKERKNIEGEQMIIEEETNAKGCPKTDEAKEIDQAMNEGEEGDHTTKQQKTEARIPCEFCDRTYSKKMHLDQHLHRNHGVANFYRPRGEGPLSCEFCRASFYFKHDIKKHWNVCTEKLKVENAQ